MTKEAKKKVISKVRANKIARENIEQVSIVKSYGEGYIDGFKDGKNSINDNVLAVLTGIVFLVALFLSVAMLPY